MKKSLFLSAARIFFIWICFVFFSFSFVSCQKKTAVEISGNENGVIDLSNSIYWALTDAASTVYAVESLEFRKLDLSDSKCINKICGTDGRYIWLKMEFKVPNYLKYKSLGFVISYLHFADKVWLNGTYIGSSGKFPPIEKSSLFISHCYFFPDTAINTNGVNTILVKVWVHGRGGISNEIFVSDYESACQESNRVTFWNSRMSLMFEGGMFCAFILYFMMYIWRRKDKSHLAFAFINYATMIFMTPFFANEVPWYSSDFVSLLLFMKISPCISFYMVISFISYFIIKYLNADVSKRTKIAMYTILAIATVTTLAVPSFNVLMKLWIPNSLLMLVQLSFGVKEVIIALRTPTRRLDGLMLCFGFLPVILAVIADIVVRVFLDDISNPYFALFGWQLSIIAFIIILSIKYSRVYSRNEYLNEKLELEVKEQTKNLSIAKENLEREKKLNDIDLEMASIVQQKFFPYPSTTFKGWDIAVCYKPVAKVSGDLYDYYHSGDALDGISLFDVSGHGIAASLITMLSKNIVYRAFRESLLKKKSISTALYNVNSQIIEAKGEIENYLTGILLHFWDFDDNDVCAVDMANAGHPHPILYSAAKNEVFEVIHNEDEFQFGAIGIRGIDVSFPTIKFSMACDDVFICFTDGLTESVNKDREQFGKERVMEVLKRSASMDAQSILEDLIDELVFFTAGIPRDDDLTIIILKRKNSNEYFELLEEL